MDRVLAVYREVDLNHDGFLDKEELCAMLDAVGMSKDKASALFEAADQDGSGTIDFEEFCTWLFSDAKSVMNTSVKKGELVTKDLSMDVQVGDIVCYGIPESPACTGYSYEITAKEEGIFETIFDEKLKVEAEGSGFQVYKFKALKDGKVEFKALQKFTSKDGESAEEQYDFTINVEALPEGEKPKPDWFAWSWSEVKWVKAPANKADKFKKKMGEDGTALGWVPEIYQPKNKKVHVQPTYCFSPMPIPA